MVDEKSVQDQHHVERVRAGLPILTEASDGECGFLEHLKTTLELRAGDALLDVYFTEIPVKSANNVLKSLRSAFPDDGVIDLQHLRRVVKPKDLPQHIRPEIILSGGPGNLCILLAPTNITTHGDLRTLLASILNESTTIRSTRVPLLAPTSQTQASEWSVSHWPTIYKKTNPFGPHPSIISRATAELVEADNLMALCRQLGQESYESRVGEAVGAVIVRRDNGKAIPLAAAGDWRWARGLVCGGSGNVSAHTVLRAIGMIAKKLSRVEGKIAHISPPLGEELDIFSDLPLTKLEQKMFDQHDVSPDGYLCHDLEIYISHEPCVMCSMAILHSRFGRVIFGQRMPDTGGLCSEGGSEDLMGAGLGHGLFWRKELNWSLLAWQWISREPQCELVDSTTQV